MIKGMKKDGLVAFRVQKMMDRNGEVYVAEGTVGVPLYSREEWENCLPADHEIDPAGILTFQGRPSNKIARRCRVPEWARRAGAMSAWCGGEK